MSDTNPLHYDAVVVGGPCAGAATAMLLARGGARVALVGRASAGSDIPFTHALMRAGVIQLHRWGLLDRVIAAGTPAVRQTVFRYGDASTTVSLKRVAGVDALYAPRGTVIDPILTGAAGEAGADLIFDVTITDVERNADGRVIGVVGHDGRNQPVRLRAAIVIGADGLHSTIARSVGAVIQRRASNTSSFVYAHVSGLETSSYEWLYAPGAIVTLIPTNDDETCVSVGVPPARFHTELAGDSSTGFRRLLGEVSPELAERLAAATSPDGMRTFPGIRGFLRRPWGPGWALVGAAGYFDDPITAHGTSGALRDAQLLADATIAWLSGQMTERAAMSDYHETRDRLSLRLFTVTDAIASYGWDTRSIEGHLRSLSAAMVDEIDHLLASGPGAGSQHRPVAVASRSIGRSEAQR